MILPIKSHVSAACVHTNTTPKRGTAAFQIGQCGRRHRVHHRQHCFGIMQAVLQRFGAKELRQRHDHRTDLPNRHISHHRLKTLGQHHRHTVARVNALLGQDMAQSMGGGLQLGKAVGQCWRVSAVGDDRHAVGTVAMAGPTR